MTSKYGVQNVGIYIEESGGDGKDEILLIQPRLYLFHVGSIVYCSYEYCQNGEYDDISFLMSTFSNFLSMLVRD